jgi:hypothetical protein
VPRIETDGGTPTATVDPEPGEQILAVVNPLSETLTALPDSAFENLLVIAVDASPRDVENAVRSRDLDPAKVGVVPVRGDSADYEGQLWTADQVTPNDLTGLSIQTSRGMEYLEPERGWLVISGLGVLVVYAGADRVRRFVHQLAGIAKEQSVRGVFMLGADSVDEEVEGALESVLDRDILVGST